MEARAKSQLLDRATSAPECWEPELRAGAIHVLVSAYGRTRADLDERLAAVHDPIERLDCGVECQAVQRTQLIEGTRREHFGFADGIGQPSIEGVDGRAYPGQGVPTERRLALARLGPVRLPYVARAGWRPVKAGEFVLGYHDEDGVVAPAPASPLGRNGTFMVYRKLEQDVPAFTSLVSELAEDHYDGDTELVAAKIVGRFYDGTPLDLSPQHADARMAGDAARVNDFRFADDPKGHRCPVGAHVRRANPRASLSGGGQRTRRHRILRRGMSYEDWTENGELRARGLLFICYQASIARQFEVVNRWCVQGAAIGVAQDRDYLTAATQGDTVGMTIGGDPPTFLRPHEPLVTTRGGEYLFVPGITALEAISNDRRTAAEPAARPRPVT
jgi:Dyp-type peroxidase family